MTIYTIACPVCGKIHSSPVADKRYCSVKCRKHAAYKRYILASLRRYILASLRERPA